MLGDVAEPGMHPPSQPVRMYRDALGAEQEQEQEEARTPRLAPPTGYALIFRDSAHPPITLWRPLPPKGYAEVRQRGWLALAHLQPHQPACACRACAGRNNKGARRHACFRAQPLLLPASPAGWLRGMARH